MRDGAVLFEQNANASIPPASITKVLSLYLIFDAIRNGEARLWDKVTVSRRAAATGGSRMGLRAGDQVPLKEIIKGMAVVSGNDACVAAAEHLSGDVDVFVRQMNRKARELGMSNSVFKTTNGLPAPGQVTTARDIARLSMAYLNKYPESLHIHSMGTYTYANVTRRNANRLLGKCPGVDGLKTGFVSASGYNLSATAKRGDTRLIAVVLGAQTPGLRARETERLLEYGFRLLESRESPSLEVRRDQPKIRLASQTSGSLDLCTLPFYTPDQSSPVKAPKPDAKNLASSKPASGRPSKTTGASAGVTRGGSNVQQSSKAGSSNTPKQAAKGGAGSPQKPAGGSQKQNAVKSAGGDVKKMASQPGKSAGKAPPTQTAQTKNSAAVKTPKAGSASMGKAPAKTTKPAQAKTPQTRVSAAQKITSDAADVRKKPSSRKAGEAGKPKGVSESTAARDKRASGSFIRSSIPLPEEA